MLARVPLSFDPKAKFVSVLALGRERLTEIDVRAHFERPEGSFAARAFGNAVHGFLELVTARLAAGVLAEELAVEIAGWLPRVEAVLRGDGLPPVLVKREAQRVLGALQSALGDPEGRWLLGAREGASSEYGFTTWEERRSSFRLDRVFVAGTEPLAAGNDYLWIVDYKTGTHGRGVSADAFMAAERKKYGAQMASYARAMAEVAGVKELRVGLYYPLLPKLLWWVPDISLDLESAVVGSVVADVGSANPEDDVPRRCWWRGRRPARGCGR